LGRRNFRADVKGKTKKGEFSGEKKEGRRFKIKGGKLFTEGK